MNVSVVIPIRNEEKFITQTLSMLLYQTVLPYEVIVVNNNSLDHSVQHVQQFQQQYNKANIQLNIIDCPNGTQATSREKGVNAATSELVAFIDADTVLPPQWIEHGKALFQCNATLVGTGGPMLYQQWLMTLTNFFLYCFVNLFRSRYFFYGCNGLFRKDAYYQSGGLTGCDKFMSLHHHQEPYDDVWLTQRLRRIGKVRGYLSLYARGTIRISGETSTLRGAYKRWLRQRQETQTVLQYLHTEQSLVWTTK